jgi:hypothetical protein
VSLRRSLGRWAERARECRNPIRLATAVTNASRRLDQIAFATGWSRRACRILVGEIEEDEAFLGPLRARLAERTTYKPRAVDFILASEGGSVFFNEVTLYALVRALRPGSVVETGGTPGKSTAFMLRAMERNAHGRLVTVDLPPPGAGAPGRIARGRYHEELPEGTGSNWVVPNELRSRHTLVLGDARQKLPEVFAGLGHVDLFLHDSDHSRGHMTWEFESAWKALAPGGLLVSDDILANTAFGDFCRRESLESRSVFNLGVARVPVGVAAS